MPQVLEDRVYYPGFREQGFVIGVSVIMVVGQVRLGDQHLGAENVCATRDRGAGFSWHPAGLTGAAFCYHKHASP